MKINTILAVLLYIVLFGSLSGCAHNHRLITDNPNKNKAEQFSDSEHEPFDVGFIEGNVISEVTDINLCQVYLYDTGVTQFADAFDQSHPSFKVPDAPIVGIAPISTTKISENGAYRFENIDSGSYQIILNCIVGQDVQDESQLTDDPIQYNGFTIPNPSGIKPNQFSVNVIKGSTSLVNFIDSRMQALGDQHAEVTVKADLTNDVNYLSNLHDIWGTVNRISPRNGVTIIDGLKVNIVRMLGGINKKVKGSKVPDLDYDIATYNEQTKQYDYNFKPLTDRIDAIINEGKHLYQLVLDQPPWAFQTGYTFIPNDQKDGINFREKERVSHYGNSLPPKDKAAYNQFLQATMQHLVAKYGKEKVLTWRFRIGTEIETPNHWYGTEQDFIEHFANSVNAIRAVLPDAIIGVHTRTPSFVYRNGTVTNYKNEPIKSFANALIEYSYDNNIKYDFWGVSDYPFINNASTRDPKTKYEQFFKPLVDHPKWQTGTVIDLEEYSVITKMGGVPGYAYINSHSPQADTFNIALTDEFYQHNVHQVFQWGLRNGDKPWRVGVFESMLGHPRISTKVSSKHNKLVENVGSIVVTDLADNSIQAVTYHYDPIDIDAINHRQVTLSFTTAKPVGSVFYYRKKLAAPEHHVFYNFMQHPDAANWLKSQDKYGRGYDKYGTPKIVLNEAGMAKWNSYQHTHSLPRSSWTSWQSASTIARHDGKLGSTVNITSELPLFSFEKTDIKWHD